MSDYEKLKLEIERLKSCTKHISIGKSYLGEDIPAFFVGEGDLTLLLHGGIHAREYISSFLLLKILDYLKHFRLGVKVCVLPLTNPDGARICAEGIGFTRYAKYYNNLRTMLRGGNHRLFKANARGVDLNVNFDAEWGGGKQNEFSFNSQNFVGSKFLSERENVSLVKFTKNLAPFLTLSYHSKGKVIYFGFDGENKTLRTRERKFLKILCKETDYKGIYTKNSCGGFKDYLLTKLNSLAFTVEVGSDKLSHPIGPKYLDEIWNENKLSILKTIKEMLKYGKIHEKGNRVREKGV